MLKHAKNKFPKASFFSQDMHKTNFGDNTFDTIVCLYGTFSYSDKPLKLISEIKRLLKPNGRAILMPYSLRVKYRFMLGYCAKSYNPQLKINYFNKKIINALKDNNFKIKEIHGINYTGSPISKVFSLFRKIFTNLPAVGYKYLQKENLLFRSLNKILNNRLINTARHILIITELQ
jgi:ubiquinone/menaquinone biosynthesis C-methylase UbiE